MRHRHTDFTDLRMRIVQSHPLLLKVLLYTVLVVAGLAWHFRSTTSHADRRLEVGELSVLIPAGVRVSYDGEHLDRNMPGRPRAPGHHVLRAADPDLAGGFLLIEAAAWRLGATEPATWMAEVYPRLVRGMEKAYEPSRVLSAPTLFQAGAIPAYGGWWLLKDGSELLCAYAWTKRELFVIVMKLPPRPNDPKKHGSRTKLWAALRSLRLATSRS